MTRLLLPWISLAIFGLGTPRAVGATELHVAGGQASAAPQREAPTKGALAPDRSETDAAQAAHLTPFSAAAPPTLRGAPAAGTLRFEAQSPSAPGTLPHGLPDARAPPA